MKWAAKAKRFEIVASTRDKLILRKVKQVRMLEKKFAKRALLFVLKSDFF